LKSKSNSKQIKLQQLKLLMINQFLKPFKAIKHMVDLLKS